MFSFEIGRIVALVGIELWQPPKGKERRASLLGVVVIEEIDDGPGDTEEDEGWRRTQYHECKVLLV